ncbi:phasin family protein [Plectonema cf. radiosum LEGE 06105]|uniref:Phasin family protein n=1 Tax=Plectonema cf. radiosum LEGE 06105 TaxID=945769 RepID=A0A8J7K077_9CYAN|nr:phasin family protein [Plectonema radiosum]MBE9213391.1 phasin family protein [Plectonema cf. radiosum LEGE 06105]
MPGFGDIVKKAFYLGVGLASYASERAGGTLSELRSQVQKLADEMVAKGEMTTDEARRFVEDMMNQAQSQASDASGEATVRTEPRRIEILSDDEQPTSKDSPPEDVDQLRDQVRRMQEELRRLQRDQ